MFKANLRDISLYQNKPLLTVETLAGIEFISGHKTEVYQSQSIYGLFLSIVEKTPDGIALIEVDKDFNLENPVSFLDLSHLVDQITAGLMAQGIKEGDRVIALLPRSIDLIALFLSLARVKACYVPIDPMFPDQYKNAVMKACSSSLIVVEAIATREERANKWVTIKQLCLHGAFITPSDLDKFYCDYDALLMFSSGTTGKPKGVLHSPSQVLNRLHWMWRDYPFIDGDILAFRGSPSVMPSIWEMVGGILAGIKTVILPNELMKDHVALLEAIKKFKLSFMTIPTPLLRVILEIKNPILGLRVVITGGEFLSLPMVKNFQNFIPNAVLVDDFGATETNTILHRPFFPGREYLNMPCFYPIDNARFFIKKEEDQNTIGPLNIAGPMVAKKYEGMDPSDLFFTHEGDTYFKSADIASIEEDFGVQIHGRSEHLLKISGYTVSISAVETLLNGLTQVFQSAVLAEERLKEDCLLYAFVVLRPGSTESDLKKAINATFPKYLIPSVIRVVSELPRLPNGKLNRIEIKKMIQVNKKGLDEKQDLLSFIKACISELVGIGLEGLLEEDLAFIDLGMNSLKMMQFSNQLSDYLGERIKVAVLYDYFSVSRLFNYLSQKDQVSNYAKNKDQNKNLSQDKNNGVNLSSVIHEVNKSYPLHESIVITGYSGRFSGIDDLDELWETLRTGQKAESNKERRKTWCQNISEYQDYDAYLLESAMYFDYEFFNFKSHEALMMDPQVRLLYEEIWQTLETSGYHPSSLAGLNVGLYIGVQPSDYHELLNKEILSGSAIIQSSFSFLASQLAYYFDFKGPSLTFDTACSSSFVALYHAFQALKYREVDYALVAGVSIKPSDSFIKTTAKLGVMSKARVSAPFSQSADGFVLAEGVGCVLLRRESDVLNSEEPIYAYLDNICIAQEGKTNGLGAPSQSAQSQLIQRCYTNASVNPKDLTYFEAHGTGTPLGDPIEFEAILDAFSEIGSRPTACLMGAVKANLGHTTAAAGMASLIKILLCYEKKSYPPLANFTGINKEIANESSPFLFNKDIYNFSENSLEIASISSFGMGGVIAHAILKKPLNSKNEKTRLPARQFKKLVCWPGEKAHAPPMQKKSMDMLIKEIFSVDDFSDEDTIASLGFDSINIVALQAEIKNHLNVYISLDFMKPERSLSEIKAQISSLSIDASTIENASDENLDEIYAAILKAKQEELLYESRS